MDDTALKLVVKAKDEASGIIKDVKKNVEDAGDSSENVSRKLTAAGAAIATVGAGLTVFAKSATDFTVGAVKDAKGLGREIGVTTEEASRLTAAFGRMGIDANEARTSFGLFSKQIVAAGEASDMSTTAFGKLGLSTKNAQGVQKDFNTILFEVADKFKEMPNGVDKTALSMELFGRKGKDMLPILNLGSSGIKDLETQADKLGLTLNANTITAVEKLVASQKNLKQQTDALKISIGTATAPVLTKFNEGINSMLSALLRAPEPIRGVTTAILAFGGPVMTASGAVLGFAANIAQISPKLMGAVGSFGVLGGVIAAFGYQTMQPFINGNKILGDSLARTGTELQKLGFDTSQLKVGMDVTKFSQDMMRQSTEMVATAQRNAQTAAQGLTNANLSLAGANLNVEHAQRAYTQAVAQYGPNSLEARQANHNLAAAQQAVKDAANAARDAEKRKSDTEAELAKKKDLENTTRSASNALQQQHGIIEGLIGALGRYASSVTSTAQDTISKYRSMQPPGGVPKFSSGIKNFGGGLAYVHKGEVLANLRPGTDVYTAAESRKLLSTASDNSRSMSSSAPSQPIINITLNGNLIGGDDSSLRSLGVQLAQLVEQALRGQGVNNVSELRIS